MQLCQQVKSPPADDNGEPDYRAKTQQVMECAYNIAIAAKALVTATQAKQSDSL